MVPGSILVWKRLNLPAMEVEKFRRTMTKAIPLNFSEKQVCLCPALNALQLTLTMFGTYRCIILCGEDVSRSYGRVLILIRVGPHGKVSHPNVDG